MRKVFVLLIAIVALNFANAQKFGFIDLEGIINNMPEYEKAKAQLEKEYRDVQNQLESLQVEYNKKLQELQENMQLPDGDTAKWSKAVLQLKQQELADLQQRIVSFQNTAQQTLQQRQVQLLKPVYNKVDSVVDVIAKQKGYIFVVTKDNVYYINKSKVDDLTPEVKKALGIQ